MDPRLRKFLPLAAIAAATIAAAAAFGPYLNAPFLFDDLHTIVENPALKTLNPIHFLTHPESASRLPGTMVRPLLTFSYALDFHRAGPNPAAFRLVNILLHLLNALLVSGLVGRTRLRAWRLEAGLLFLLLPLAAIQVGYISNRSALLSALFYLGGLYLFASATDGSLPRRPAFIGMTACYLLGLLAKDSAATLPAAVALWGFLSPTERSDRKPTLAATGTLLAVFAIYMIYRQALHATTLFPAARPWPVWAYAAAQVPVTLRYLAWMVWPTNLGLAHDAWMPTTAADLISLPFMAGLVGVTALVALAIKARRSSPELSFGLGLFFIYLLPTNSLIPLVMPANENRPYLGGLSLVLALLTAARAADRPQLIRGLLAAIIILFLALTRARAGEFSSPVAAWTQAARLAPQSHRVWHNLGLARLEFGRASEARLAFLRAVALEPCAAASLNSLGNLAVDSDPRTAADLYRRALQCDRTLAGARVNLAEMLMAERRGEQGAALLRDGLRFDPQNPELLGRLGLWHAGRGEPAARDYLQAALTAETSPARARRWAEALAALPGN